MLHRFAKPALTFILQNMLPNKTWAQKVDKEMKKAVKTAFKLPRRTASASLYAPPHSGVARGLLEEVARRRTGGPIEMENFLNYPPVPSEGKKADIKSLWSAVQKSLQRFSAMIDIEWKTLTCGGKVVGWGKRKDTSKLLRAQRHKAYINQLKSSPDQGRTFSCVSAHTASNSFIRSGRYIYFSEYRFAIKARLNLLPTKTVLRQCGKRMENVSCPACNMEQETLAYI